MLAIGLAQRADAGVAMLLVNTAGRIAMPAVQTLCFLFRFPGHLTLPSLVIRPIHVTKKTSNMPSVFETAPAASAIPITFATKSTWDAISAELPAQARQFASSNGFAAKPGACLTLPAADGQIAQVLFGLEEANGKACDLFGPGALPGLLPA